MRGYGQRHGIVYIDDIAADAHGYLIGAADYRGSAEVRNEIGSRRRRQLRAKRFFSGLLSCHRDCGAVEVVIYHIGIAVDAEAARNLYRIVGHGELAAGYRGIVSAPTAEIMALGSGGSCYRHLCAVPVGHCPGNRRGVGGHCAGVRVGHVVAVAGVVQLEHQLAVGSYLAAGHRAGHSAVIGEARVGLGGGGGSGAHITGKAVVGILQSIALAVKVLLIVLHLVGCSVQLEVHLEHECAVSIDGAAQDAAFSVEHIVCLGGSLVGIGGGDYAVGGAGARFSLAKLLIYKSIRILVVELYAVLGISIGAVCNRLVDVIVGHCAGDIELVGGVARDVGTVNAVSLSIGDAGGMLRRGNAGLIGVLIIYSKGVAVAGVVNSGLVCAGTDGDGVGGFVVKGEALYGLCLNIDHAAKAHSAGSVVRQLICLVALLHMVDSIAVADAAVVQLHHIAGGVAGDGYGGGRAVVVLEAVDGGLLRGDGGAHLGGAGIVTRGIVPVNAAQVLQIVADRVSLRGDGLIVEGQHILAGVRREGQRLLHRRHGHVTHHRDEGLGYHVVVGGIRLVVSHGLGGTVLVVMNGVVGLDERRVVEHYLVLAGSLVQGDALTYGVGQVAVNVGGCGRRAVLVHGAGLGGLELLGGALFIIVDSVGHVADVYPPGVDSQITGHRQREAEGAVVGLIAVAVVDEPAAEGQVLASPIGQTGLGRHGAEGYCVGLALNDDYGHIQVAGSPLGVEDKVCGRHLGSGKAELRTLNAALGGVPALEGVYGRVKVGAGWESRNMICAADIRLVEILAYALVGIIVVECQVRAVAGIVEVYSPSTLNHFFFAKALDLLLNPIGIGRCVRFLAVAGLYVISMVGRAAERLYQIMQVIFY